VSIKYSTTLNLVLVPETITLILISCPGRVLNRGTVHPAVQINGQNKFLDPASHQAMMTWISSTWPRRYTSYAIPAPAEFKFSVKFLQLLQTLYCWSHSLVLILLLHVPLSQILASFYLHIIQITGFLALLILYTLIYQMVTMDVPCFLIRVLLLSVNVFFNQH